MMSLIIVSVNLRHMCYVFDDTSVSISITNDSGCFSMLRWKAPFKYGAILFDDTFDFKMCVQTLFDLVVWLEKPC